VFRRFGELNAWEDAILEADVTSGFGRLHFNHWGLSSSLLPSSYHIATIWYARDSLTRRVYLANRKSILTNDGPLDSSLRLLLLRQRGSRWRCYLRACESTQEQPFSPRTPLPCTVHWNFLVTMAAQKVALITAGTAGLGAQIARVLAPDFRVVRAIPSQVRRDVEW